MKNNRYGRFKISVHLIWEYPKYVQNLLSNVLVINVDANPATLNIEYYAYCDEFDAVVDEPFLGDTPTYYLAMDGDKFIVSKKPLEVSMSKEVIIHKCTECGAYADLFPYRWDEARNHALYRCKTSHSAHEVGLISRDILSGEMIALVDKVAYV